MAQPISLARTVSLAVVYRRVGSAHAVKRAPKIVEYDIGDGTYHRVGGAR
jgi:hypothetical protein